MLGIKFNIIKACRIAQSLVESKRSQNEASFPDITYLVIKMTFPFLFLSQNYRDFSNESKPRQLKVKLTYFKLKIYRVIPIKPIFE